MCICICVDACYVRGVEASAVGTGAGKGINICAIQTGMVWCGVVWYRIVEKLRSQDIEIQRMNKHGWTRV